MNTALQILEVIGQLAGLAALLIIGRQRRDQANLPGWLRFIQAGMAAIAPDKIPAVKEAEQRPTTTRLRRESRTRIDTPPPLPIVRAPAEEAVPAPIRPDDADA